MVSFNLYLYIGFCSFVTAYAAAQAARPTAVDCDQLSKNLPGRVAFPGSGQYDESISSYWFKQARLLPKCIVRPVSTKEVALAVQILAASSSPFAVKGGGHATVVGASNIKDGITVDLRFLNAVSYDQRTTIARVGAGALSEDLYEILDPYDATALAGRVSSVGVGGFLTGGGLSFSSPEKGFACDLVTNFEVVLANGQIVNANVRENNDLFIALKGGANNFGVVTRFDIQTIKQKPFWGGGIVYPESTFAQQIDAFNKFKDPKRFDPKVSLEQSFVYLGGLKTFIVSTSMFHTGSQINASALVPFTSIQPQLSNTMRISNTSDFAREVYSLSTPNQYSVWATTSFGVGPSTISKVVAAWRTSALNMNAIVNMTSSMTFNEMPAAAPASNPNSLGFTPGSSPEKKLVLMLISIFFDDPTAYDALQTATRSFIDAVDQITKQDGVKEKFVYLNYAAKWQDAFSSYGARQVEALRRTAKKYDPNGVFQRKVPGGFKLF